MSGRRPFSPWRMPLLQYSEGLRGQRERRVVECCATDVQRDGARLGAVAVRQHHGLAVAARIDRHDGRDAVFRALEHEGTLALLGEQYAEVRIRFEGRGASALFEGCVHMMPERVAVGDGCLHGRCALTLVDGQVEGVGGGLREAVVPAAVPLHRRARAGARVAALLAGQVTVAHADLVAVVDERHAGHEEDRAIGEGQFADAQTWHQTRGVVVAGDEVEVGLCLARRFEPRLVLFEERHDAGSGIHVEIAAVAVVEHGGVGVAQQHVVAVGHTIPAPVEVEVHVEAGFERLVGASPFRDERGFGVFPAQLPEHVLPGANRIGFAVIVTLHQAVGHVHAETVGAHVEPEAHHVEHRVAGAQCFIAECRGLPAFARMGKAVVERRLEREEVHDVGAVAGFGAADERQPVAPFDPVVGPDVAVVVQIRRIRGTLVEPGVLVRRMARHEVEQHVHAARVRRFEQRGEVVVGAIARGHFRVIADVVAGVAERRLVERVEPDRVASQLQQVIEVFDDAGDVSDAVGVRVRETLRVDLVERGLVEPLWNLVIAAHAVSPAVCAGMLCCVPCRFVCFMPAIRPEAIFDNVCNYALQYNH